MKTRISRKKVIKLHRRKSERSLRKHLESRCYEPCSSFAEKAAQHLMEGHSGKAEFYFDAFGKCKRSCISAGVGKRYRKSRGL